MTRRRIKRPVERLRSGWTSTADLEETLTAMFADPPDNLSGETAFRSPDSLSVAPDETIHVNAQQENTIDVIPPDNLSGEACSLTQDILSGEGEAILTGGPPDILSVAPPGSLSAAPPGKLSEVFNVGSREADQAETEPVPPDILTGGTSDTLNGAFSDTLADPPPDSLQSQPNTTDIPAPSQQAPSESPPPDKLSGTLYETVDGDVVNARFIRPYDSVQSAHTPSEHLVYTTMWKMLGTRDDDGPSREGILPLAAVAQKTSISLRNLRRVVRSLEQKFAIEVTQYEDKTRSIPRRYRVWGFKSTIERRRRAGYGYIYRNRNLITLARPYRNSAITGTLSGGAGDNLSGGASDNLTGHPRASLSSPARDNLALKPPDNLSACSIKALNNKTEATSSSSHPPVPSVVTNAVREELGFVDDDALAQIVHRCRERTADATDEEIADFAKAAAHRIRSMRNLTNPVGLLITQVPKHFEGQSFALYREEKRRAREIQRQMRLEQRKQAQAILDNPNTEPFEREWAQTVLEAPENEI